MVAIPFFYFSLLLLFILKKKKTFEISAYVVSLYAVSSFFSIVIDLNNLRSFDTIDYKISLEATIVYCLLLTITILPFYFYKSEKIEFIGLRKPRLFNSIVYFYFFCCVFLVLISFTFLVRILNGDPLALRYQAATQGPVADIKVSGLLKIVFMMTSVFGEFSVIMLVFYFYSLCFLHRSKLFNGIILLSSLTILVIAILGIDRSKVIYWLITFGFLIVFFKRFIHKKQKKDLIISTSFIIFAILVYFLFLTFSRFGQIEEGTQGSLVSYSGQSFINFAFFYDEVHYQQISLQRVFPLFYKLFVPNGIESSVALNREITMDTGVSIGVFSTFIGDIMVSSGKLFTFLYCIFFSLFCILILNFKKRKKILFYQLVLLYCLISIPMLGVFVHFYANFAVMVSFLLFMFVAFYIRFSRKRRIESPKNVFKN